MDKAILQVTDYLWSQSGQIALLVAAVAILSHVLRHRSAHARYLLWLLVVAKCLVPPFFGVAVPILPQDEQAAAPVPLGQFTGLSTEVTAAGVSDMADGTTPPQSPRETSATRGLLPVISAREATVLLWLTGLIIFLAIASMKAARMMRRLIRERRDLPAEIRCGIRQLFGTLGLGRRPRVWLIESASQPFVWGLWRGDIYLPAGFASLSDSEHRRDILAHELSHVLRFDAAVNLLQIFAQAIFWFHPLVWWANVRIRQEREKCCDEAAIARLGAQPRSYSQAIVEALLVEHKSNGLMPSLAIAGPAKNVEERIKTMLRPGKRFYRRPSLLAAACALVLALLIVPTTLALTSRPADAAQEVAAKPTAEQIEQQRTLSAEKLKKFVLGLVMYAAEHEGRYPAHNEISWASEEDPNTFDTFLLEKVEYLGEGKTRPETNAFVIPLAFDIPLLRVAGGTNVAFADGHVEFITTERLAARGVTIPKVSLKATDIRFEPVHQGKNVVHVTVRNTSDQEQLFAAHIYTRSPDYGVSDPDPDKGGVGWGTSGYFDTLKPKEAREVRLVFKIQGPVTDRTYVNLRFSNPETQESYDGKWYFYSRKYMSAELPKAKANDVVQERASPAEAQAITQAFSQIQRDILDRQYDQAWERFSKDYQMAEYQRYGLVWFRRAMEPTHPMHSAFTWERGDFLKLTPGQVSRHSGVLALAAGFEGQTWTIDFVREDNQWKIDWIAGYTPAVIRIQKEEWPAPAGGSGNLTIPQGKPAATAEKAGNLNLLDVQFEPVHQGKNVVRIKAENITDQDQAFVVYIQTRSPDYAPGGVGWGTSFPNAIKGKTSAEIRLVFHIQGPVTDATWVRLRFYNPGPAAGFDVEKWFASGALDKWLIERKYFGKDLERQAAQPALTQVSEARRRTILNALRTIQGDIESETYDDAWKSFTKDYQDAGFTRNFQIFENTMTETNGPNRFSWLREDFLKLKPGSVGERDGVSVLTAACDEQRWTLDFVQDEGQWKLDWIAGFTPGYLRTVNWEERVLPKMEKRSTSHLDIYYLKGSTAAREIGQIARQKDDGFRQVCQFLGQESNIRIRLVLFEDGLTKQRATGHQGAGWAYHNTIVEVYNDKEKLDPYHETTHILMGPLGNPPALFNEGFAVYMSEKLGAHALENLGGGQATLYERTKELKSKGDWIELPELLTFTDIGPAESRPPVSYAEAASFVKFLIDTCGKDKFLQAYQSLQNSSEKATQEQNVKSLEQICGQSLQTLQQQWEAAFTRS